MEDKDIKTLRYYTAQESVNFYYYPVPFCLFSNPPYKGLSLSAKLMYSILRYRLRSSIKNNWKDEAGYIYLIYTIDEMAELLETSRMTVIKLKKELIKHDLLVDKRLGQGKPNRLYVLKPEFRECDIYTSRSKESLLLEVNNLDFSYNDELKRVNLNNVTNVRKEKLQKRTPENESWAQDIAESLGDLKSLGWYRKCVDELPADLIYQALSEVKDVKLSGRVNKSQGALFTSVIKAKAAQHNIKI